MDLGWQFGPVANPLTSYCRPGNAVSLHVVRTPQYDGDPVSRCGIALVGSFRLRTYSEHGREVGRRAPLLTQVGA